MAEDIRVLMVKLADRLHNMRTLEFMKPVKQRLIAQETQDIYAPLANRLGLHRVKTELEDLCLKYLKPDVFGQLSEAVSEHRAAGEPYIEKVIDLMNDMLKKNKLKGRVYGRTKHLHSIHVKMEQQGLTFDEIYDLIAFRIIVKSLKDCYAVLGLIHSIWRPVPGRFKDYISIPKANMYQSLHSTVIGPDGERIEFQIRTEEMNQIAEYGVAAHWQYKEVGKGTKKGRTTGTRDAERYTWLKQIMDWQRELSDPREFMSSLRLDMFQEEVYVFTPTAISRNCPKGRLRWISLMPFIPRSATSAPGPRSTGVLCRCTALSRTVIRSRSLPTRTVCRAATGSSLSRLPSAYPHQAIYPNR